MTIENFAEQRWDTTKAGLIRLSPLHTIHPAETKSATGKGWHVAGTSDPLADQVAAARADVIIADLSDQTKILVEGREAGARIQTAFGGSVLKINQGLYLADPDLHVYCLRRDRFYISAAAGRENEIIRLLNSASGQVDGLVTLTDETDGRCELLLLGPAAAACLGRVCGLDFHAAEFPNHTAKQSSLAKTSQLIIRRDIQDLSAYILSGGRSYALYLWETLLQAGSDLNIRPIGPEAVEALQSKGNKPPKH